MIFLLLDISYASVNHVLIVFMSLTLPHVVKLLLSVLVESLDQKTFMQTNHQNAQDNIGL